MRMRNRIALVACTVCLLSSCTEDSLISQKEQEVALSISNVSINNGSSATRAELTNVTSIGVSRLPDANYTAQTNYGYTYSGAWTATNSNQKIKALIANATLCAYTPYSSSINPASIALTSGKYSAPNDFCYGYLSNLNFTNIGSGVAFTLNHAYAEITLRFTKDNLFQGTGNVTSITINGAASNGTLNISTTTPSLTPTTGTVSVSGTPLFNINTAPRNTADVEVLMVPTNISSGLTFTLTIDGRIKNCTLPAATLNKLTAGKNYIIPIQILTNDILVLTDSSGNNTVSTTDWSTSANADNNIATPPEANCYMVTPGATVFIPVSRAVAGNPSFTSSSPFTCELLWSDISRTHVALSVFGRYIKVKASATRGNSVICAKNQTGDIVWSWHIWVTDYQPNVSANGSVYTSTNGYTWMDRDIGTINIANGTNNLNICGGLIYQWGRKDPFSGSDNSATINNAPAKTLYGYTPVSSIGGTQTINITNDNYITLFTIGNSPVMYNNAFSYSVQYPAVMFANWGGSTATIPADSTSMGGAYSWNSSYGSKTIYDPCPAGWRVPPLLSGGISPWASWSNVPTFTSSTTAFVTWGSDVIYGTYPVAGERYNGALTNVGSYGFYWIGNVAANPYASSMNFNSGNINPLAPASRSSGYTVRCIME